MLSVYHMTAFTIGFVMDLLFGDPYWLPHPIRLIGNWISFLEKRLLGSKTEEKHIAKNDKMAEIV